MTADAVKAMSPVQQENAPVTEKKSSSIWNSMCVTVVKGCDKVADFFNKTFTYIGNFFKKVGNFLWKNKVTASVCAFLSAITLGVAAVALAMFGKKKEEKPITTTPQPKADEPKEKEKVEDTEEEAILEDEEPSRVVIRQSGNKDKTCSIEHLDQRPSKARKTNEEEKVAGEDHVRFMAQQFEEAQKRDPEPKEEHDVQSAAPSSSFVQQMQQQLQEEEKAPKDDEETKDHMKSSIDMSEMRARLAALGRGPFGGPPPVRTAPTTTQTSERNTKTLSDILAKRAKGPSRRPPSRYVTNKD